MNKHQVVHCCCSLGSFVFGITTLISTDMPLFVSLARSRTQASDSALSAFLNISPDSHLFADCVPPAPSPRPSATQKPLFLCMRPSPSQREKHKKPKLLRGHTHIHTLHRALLYKRETPPFLALHATVAVRTLRRSARVGKFLECVQHKSFQFSRFIKIKLFPPANEPFPKNEKSTIRSAVRENVFSCVIRGKQVFGIV